MVQGETNTRSVLANRESISLTVSRGVEAGVVVVVNVAVVVVVLLVVLTVVVLVDIDIVLLGILGPAVPVGEVVAGGLRVRLPVPLDCILIRLAGGVEVLGAANAVLVLCALDATLPGFAVGWAERTVDLELEVAGLPYVLVEVLLDCRKDAVVDGAVKTF